MSTVYHLGLALFWGPWVCLRLGFMTIVWVKIIAHLLMCMHNIWLFHAYQEVKAAKIHIFTPDVRRSRYLVHVSAQHSDAFVFLNVYLKLSTVIPVLMWCLPLLTVEAEGPSGSAQSRKGTSKKINNIIMALRDVEVFHVEFICLYWVVSYILLRSTIYIAVLTLEPDFLPL